MRWAVALVLVGCGGSTSAIDASSEASPDVADSSADTAETSAKDVIDPLDAPKETGPKCPAAGDSCDGGMQCGPSMVWECSSGGWVLAQDAGMCSGPMCF